MARRRRRGYPSNPRVNRALLSADRSVESAKRWQIGADEGDDFITKLEGLIVRRKDKKTKYDQISKFIKDKNLTKDSIMPSFNEFVRDDNPDISIKGIPMSADSLYQASYLDDPNIKKINEIFGVPDPVTEAAKMIRKNNPGIFNKVNP